MTDFAKLQAETAAEVHHRIRADGRCLSIYRGMESFRPTIINRDGAVRVRVGSGWYSAYLATDGLKNLIVGPTA